MECPKPNAKPKSPWYPTFGLFEENEPAFSFEKIVVPPITERSQDFAWLLTWNLSRTPKVEVQQEPVQNEDPSSATGQEEPIVAVHIPVQSGYNLLIKKTMPIT